MKKKRVAVTLGIIASVLGFVLFMPFPHYVTCSLEIKPNNAVKVYVHTPGRLEKLLKEYGDQVREGEKVAVLSNRDLELEIEKLRGEIDIVAAERRLLIRTQIKNPIVGARIPELEETIRTKQDQLKEKLESVAELEITAPKTGTILPPPSRPPPKNDLRLASWTGLALEEKNLGAFLQAGDEICQIGDPHSLNAELVVDQADIEFIDVNQQVEIRLYAYPDQTLTSKIATVSRRDMKMAPRSLTAQAGGDVAARIDEEGMARPISASYQASAPIDPSADQRIGLHLRGQARVYTGWRSLGERLWRYVMRTFHFHM